MSEAQIGQIVVDVWEVVVAGTFLISLGIYIATLRAKPPKRPRL
jgi:hypothetical protein